MDIRRGAVLITFLAASASSVIALPLFVSADKPNNLLFMVISVLVGAVATFAATWVLYKPEAANK